MPATAATKDHARSVSYIVAAIATVLIVVDVLRIVKVPVTHDEGITYNDYITASWLDIISVHPTSANDHILNSLFSKFFRLLFGEGQFVLRLTSLLSLVLYQYFSFRLLKKFSANIIFIVAGFLLLNCNPFLFEFFGLCRGYALSIALMMCSTWFLLRYADEEKIALQWYSLAAAMAAVYASYSLLYFFLGHVVAIAYIVFKRTGLTKAMLRRLLPCLCSAVVLFLTVVGNLKAMHDDDQLYFGGDRGFVQDTLTTLSQQSLYLKANDHLSIVVAWVLAGITIGIGLCWLFKTRARKKTSGKPYGIILFILLVMPAVANIAQHHLTGGKYLIERTALFYYPLLVINILYVLTTTPRLFMRTLPALIAIAAVIHFSKQFNLTKTRSWPDDAPVLLVMKKMLGEKKPGVEKIKVRVSWRLQPAMQYYIASRYAASFEPVLYTHNPANADTSFDYYYIHVDEAPFVAPIYNTDTIVNSGRFLLMRKQ